MDMKIKTSFANGVNPFQAPIKPATQPTPKIKKPLRNPIDFASLVMANDPIPEYKQLGKKTGKYAPMLERMLAGECIKCRKADVDILIRNMTGLVRRRYPDYMLSSMLDYGDGMGRIWMLPREEKA